MSCQVEVRDFVGSPATIFFCTQPAEPCATCQQPEAPYLCDWKVMKRVAIRVEDFKVGDVYATANQQRVVVKIDELGEERRLWIAVGTNDPWVTRAPKWAMATTLKAGTCDAPCCDAHAREVGEEVHYCSEHWNSWQTVS